MRLWVSAGVAGAVRGRGADPFILGDLVEQLRQNRALPSRLGVNSTARMSDDHG
jgi:hypothetical protein